MLGDAISYPRQGDDWLKTVLIGGVLSLLGFLVVPLFLVTGYLVRVLRSAAYDEAEPPVFDEWGDLLVDGLKAFVIGLVYVGIPLALLFAGAFALGVGGALVGGSAGAGLGIAGLLFALVMGVITIVAGYAVPAATANFACNDDFGAAFAFGDVVEVVIDGDYFAAWVLALVIGIVGGVIGNLLAFVIVGIFVLFYVQVSVYYLFGRGYGKARGLGGSAADTAVTA